MKLKLFEHEGKAYAEVQDGRPIYVEDDGKETPFDAPHTRDTIKRLNSEAKGFRERAEGAEARLKNFDGLDDPDAARRALETLKNIDQGQLIQAGKVEEIKAEARKAAEEQITNATKASGEKIKALTKERDGAFAELHAEKIGGAFSRSKFLNEKIAAPIDMVQAMFGPRFKLEDGKVVGHDGGGNKIYSRTKPGEIADFDEALESMVDAYAYRDTILKGTGSTGSGAQPHRNGAAGEKTMPRAEFDRLPPPEQASKIKAGIRPV